MPIDNSAKIAAIVSSTFSAIMNLITMREPYPWYHQPPPPPPPEQPVGFGRQLQPGLVPQS